MKLPTVFKDTGFFETNDLYLTAFLVHTGYKIIMAEKVDRIKFKFCFTKSLEIKASVKQYWDGESNVEPRQYMTTIRTIKARISEPA